MYQLSEHFHCIYRSDLVNFGTKSPLSVEEVFKFSDILYGTITQDSNVIGIGHSRKILDIWLLSVNSFSSSEEGITLVLDGLAKQSRPNHMRPPVFIRRYKDVAVCLVEYFMA